MIRIFARVVSLIALLLCVATASAEPKRIVSIAPSFTEILYALGAGPQIVGTTLYCDYPAEATKTEKIGDVLNPNVEKIISLKPDIVFAGNWKWNVPEKLRAAGILVVEVPDAQTLDDVFQRFNLIAGKINRLPAATQLIATMKQQMEEIRKRAAAKPQRTVYMEIDAGNWTVGGQSYLTEILKVLGLRNVFGERQEPYLTVTMESVVARNPDLLMSLSRTQEEYQSLAAWRALRAVREGKIIDKNAIDWNAITHQGSRLIEGIQQLDSLLNK
ncbi:ABC transporter substrate-binding protein [bacterium]|nr:ABC transporter substrate-binding protein [bacterium]MCI0602205.1 ABC transporter substrate-binding protein [bacterium]